MNIVEIEDDDLQSRLGQSGSDRSRDKVHISDVYKILMKRLQPERFDTGKPMDMSRVEVGLLFENMLERAMAEKFATIRPGEIVSEDGTDIYMSPDGVNPSEMAGEEYKATFLSCRNGVSETVVVDGESCDVPLDKFVHWFIQMKAYSRWLDLRTFFLRVLFLNGNYNRSGILKGTKDTPDPESGPTFKSYKITFTDKEVYDNWAMLIDVAREEGLVK